MDNCVSLEALQSMVVSADSRWNREESKPLLMHSVHVYPAKFPPMIAEEAFNYAAEEGVACHTVADFFCGCGTVALESKLRGLSFWGCDINPVAVLIARAKTNPYDVAQLEMYFDKIRLSFKDQKTSSSYSKCYEFAPNRLIYWFLESTYQDLYCLKKAIDDSVSEESYLTAFYCIFSSILKSSSKWLQKSIKPQVDPNKKEADVSALFSFQAQKFINAVREIDKKAVSDSNIEIQHMDFLNSQDDRKVDLVVTSPPYVTSYEYADLHQLSSLWLGFADDYRDLRKGSIGSTYQSQDVDIKALPLNNTGRAIVSELVKAKAAMAKTKAIARYYSDMERVVMKSAEMLNMNGMALFVVGNSELKGVKLLNSDHLIESMSQAGFSDIKIGKRTIEKCICIPYRDKKGKFTTQDLSTNEIYHEEYIISGRIKWTKQRA